MTGQKFLTEAMLRALCLPDGGTVPVPPDTVLTPSAQEYCAARGLQIARGRDWGAMPQSGGSDGFTDAASGQPLAEKPEHMTHLRENLLVAKTHPRILLRGKLDSLEALLLQTQCQALREGRETLAQRLEECFAFVQGLLGAEVRETALEPICLLGMDSARLRHASHHPQECFGIAHPVPEAAMGSLCLALNYLRTQVREAELAAVRAFIRENGTLLRTDIIEALNRLSSAVYLLFLSALTGKEV
jgi:ethanolamine utilization cobalamin adenosyltransferase